MDYIDYKSLLKETDGQLSNNSSYNIEVADQEYLNKEREKLKYLCECSNGHHFDYRKRIRYPTEDKTHAPCQGKCPICGDSQISMWSKKLYPIRFNFIGGQVM